MSTLRVKVLGMKFFQGEVNGSKIDSGKLFTECKLDDSRNDSRQFAKGIWTEEWKLANAEPVKAMAHLPLPFDAELEIERVGNGKESREVIVNVRPIELSKPSAVKAAA